MTISLRRPETGQTKILPEGWSWGCFFGSFFLGVPLFSRGLQVWGSVMLVFNVAMLIVALTPTDRAAALYGWMAVIGLGLAVFFGLRANRMALDRHLSLGWEYADPQRRKWG